MGMIRKTKGLLVAGVFVLCSSGSLFAVEPNAELARQLDTAVVAIKDNATGRYLTVQVGVWATWDPVRLGDRVNDPNVPDVKEGLHQLFKVYKTADGFVGFQCLASGKYLQICLDANPFLYPSLWKNLRAWGGGVGSWEKFALDGSDLNNVKLWNSGANAYVAGGPRVYWAMGGFLGLVKEPRSTFDPILWGPDSGDINTGRGLGLNMDLAAPLSFSIVIVEETDALKAEKARVLKEAAEKALALAKAEADKAAALEKKNADELRLINADQEKKIKSLEAELASRSSELKHVSEVMASADAVKQVDLAKNLAVKAEEIVKTEQMKKDGQVEKAKEEAKVDAKVEQLKAEAKDKPAKVEAAAAKVEKAEEKLAVAKAHVEEVKQEIKDAKTEAKAEAVKPETREAKVETAKEEAKEAVAAKPAVKKTVAAKKKTKAPAKKVATKPTKKVAAKGKAISRDKAGRPAGKKKPAKKTIKRKVSAKKPAKTPAAKAKTPAKAPAKAVAPAKTAPVAAMPVATDATEPEETDTEETGAEEAAQ